MHARKDHLSGRGGGEFFFIWVDATSHKSWKRVKSFIFISPSKDEIIILEKKINFVVLAELLQDIKRNKSLCQFLFKNNLSLKVVFCGRHESQNMQTT